MEFIDLPQNEQKKKMIDVLHILQLALLDKYDELQKYIDVVESYDDPEGSFLSGFYVVIQNMVRSASELELERIKNTLISVTTKEAQETLENNPDDVLQALFV